MFQVLQNIWGREHDSFLDTGLFKYLKGMFLYVTGLGFVLMLISCWIAAGDVFFSVIPPCRTGLLCPRGQISAALCGLLLRIICAVSAKCMCMWADGFVCVFFSLTFIYLGRFFFVVFFLFYFL